MHCNQASAAASVNRHAGPVEIEKVGYAVCHDCNAISGGSVLRLPIWVSEANLFVVCIKLAALIVYKRLHSSNYL